jgi:hypothetical protein
MFAVFESGPAAHIAGVEAAVNVTVRVSPGVRLLNVQLYCEPLFSGPVGVQSLALAPPLVQLNPVPGIVSVSDTLCCPVPPAVTVTAKTRLSPAVTGPLPLFATLGSGQFTTTEAGASWLLTVPSNVAVAPVFSIVPHVPPAPGSPAVVVPVTETVIDPLAGTVSPVHESVPAVTEHDPVPDVVLAVDDQLTPVATGSASLTETFVATTPVVFVTVNVQPMAAPAFTGPAGLATFAMVTFGQFTVTLADPEVEVTPITVAVALSFVIGPQASRVVTPLVEPLTCTTKVPLFAGTVRPVHESVVPPPVMEHPAVAVLHTTPVMFGSVSLTDTPVATTVEVFVIVRSKPIGEPRFTGPTGFAVLAMVSAGQTIVTWFVAGLPVTVPWFAGKLAVAVFV